MFKYGSCCSWTLTQEQDASPLMPTKDTIEHPPKKSILGLNSPYNHSGHQQFCASELGAISGYFELLDVIHYV